MSGSGGFSGSPSITTPCDNLKFKTDLASPKPIALSLNIGDILDIDLNQQGIIALFNGQLAGGIACKESSRLSYCLSKGNSYGATVIQINNARITISVYPI